ncbi:DnaJ-like protein xdj1 [Elasticomyces elasticus]|nr:DnaJ-like protein xdj1 [Elasticomyces elasticus]
MSRLSTEEVTDLYEVLGVSTSATKVEIKKAYHKAALANHPDKVPEDERESADIRFKSISRAYEILSDDSSRNLYDTHGMDAFDKSSRSNGFSGADVDMEDILAQMFGMGGGFEGMHGSFGGGGGPGGMGGGRTGKGKSEVQEYEVSLEELYKGKTTRFASTKNVICSHCKGSGGKEKAKTKKCGTCDGKGMQTRLRTVGPGLVTQETVPCTTCAGRGKYFADKDKCKKCKGARTVSQKKLLELYIPRGSREGEHIVLAGEADQVPDQEPGDIVFKLEELSHETFRRAGADLQADLNVTLAEALTGFNRVVLKHLDGRGIQLNVTQPRGRILQPNQILKVPGEGMPIKKSDARGDLYLVVKIQFPEDGWLKDEATLKRIQDVLPKPGPAIQVEMADEVDWDVAPNLDGFGAGSGDPRAAGAEWEDEEDEGDGTPQCAQQ